MSSFSCEQCGRPQIDSDIGYVEGCSHYPPHGRLVGSYVDIWFGRDDEEPSLAFYVGAWYMSEEARRERRAVHPVAWRWTNRQT